VLGIGEAARAYSASLRAAGAEVVDWDISARFGHDVRLGGDYAGEPPAEAAVMAIHLNPRELVQLVAMTGGAPFKDRFCVGCWAWELEQVPPSWKAALCYVDEVWTPSRFVADAVALVTPPAMPVRVFPHPLAPSAAAPDRPGLGLPEDKVVVLTAFDVRSGFTRKNPIAAVRAFRAATRMASMPAVMICKAAGIEGSPGQMDQLRAEIGDAGDVRLMTDWLTGAQMAALTASADILLSLHRSEGFGLLPAQAMLAGKAVVATGWSGNLDFMTGDDSVLVDYALVHVRLAALIDDAAARRALGARAAEHAAQALDPVRLGRQARAWLGQVRKVEA
jgi:glycosyltransferase involved in cell wall biosynthesis